MKEYPSILPSKLAPIGKPCTAFYKYDGSCLRWEWTPKRGWFKFGTRNHLFDATDQLYGPAIPLFLNGPAMHIQQGVLSIDKNCQRITAFTEFFGKNSFAGSHIEDEPKQLKLIDVFLFKKGLIPTKPFLKLFSGNEWSPEVMYEGDITPKFIEDVRSGKFPVVEGVVCKGNDFMVKIKTRSYIEKLKAVYLDKWQTYAE